MLSRRYLKCRKGKKFKVIVEKTKQIGKHDIDTQWVTFGRARTFVCNHIVTDNIKFSLLIHGVKLIDFGRTLLKRNIYICLYPVTEMCDILHFVRVYLSTCVCVRERVSIMNLKELSVSVLSIPEEQHIYSVT